MKTDLKNNYVPRGLGPALEEALTDTPVVCLLGPRQCGKSTLARHCEPERVYLSLDDRTYLDLALHDPQGFVDGLPERVAIDEVQRAPGLSLAIKRSVDANRKPGRFLLTGSANLLQLPRLADSLAGRMECLYLQPFTVSEIEGTPGHFLADWLGGRIHPAITASSQPRPSQLPWRLVAGGYPEAVSRSPQRARKWQKGYIQSIIERDIHDIAAVKDGSDLARLLAYLSEQVAQLLNQSAVSKALGHSRATVERYLNILEKLFLIRRLPAWHSNRSKRLVKSPKLHFVDSGLAASLSQLQENQWNEARERFGHLLESFVLQQLIAMSGWINEPISFYHYRDKDQVEVDIVLEWGNRLWGVEVKTAASVGVADARGLLRLASVAGKQYQGGIVFYDGPAILPLNREHNILAVPIEKLWER